MNDPNDNATRLAPQEARRRVITEIEHRLRREQDAKPIATNLGEKLRAVLEGEVSK